MRFLGQRIQEGYCAQGEEGDGDRTTSRRESVYDIFEGDALTFEKTLEDFQKLCEGPAAPSWCLRGRNPLGHGQGYVGKISGRPFLQQMCLRPGRQAVISAATALEPFTLVHSQQGHSWFIGCPRLCLSVHLSLSLLLRVACPFADSVFAQISQPLGSRVTATARPDYCHGGPLVC